MLQITSSKYVTKTVSTKALKQVGKALMGEMLFNKVEASSSHYENKHHLNCFHQVFL